MNRFLCVILFSIVPIILFSQKKADNRPRLVVVLMVDDLNADQLFTWQEKFEKGGINRMMNQGTLIPRVSYNTTSTYVGASVATFYSGATPAVHGIISSQWMDRFSQVPTDALYGPDFKTVPDSLLKPSTNMLLVTTLTDELRRLYPNYSKIRGIGLNDHIMNWAIGHGGDGYYSVDIKTGLISNKQNKEVPFWVREFNSKKFPEIYKMREWGPINNINDYYESKFHRSRLTENFLYRFNEDTDYRRLIYSPYGNVMIRDFAASMIINEGLGKDEYPDLLTISLSLKPRVIKNSKPMDAEVEDMAIRLDHEITGLIRLFEETIGMENVLMILTGAHNPGIFPDDYKTLGAPTGSFSGKKALSLLNLYFMAQYGQEKWALSYNDGAFYLNTQLIESKGMSVKEMRSKAADFLIQMSGVARTHTYDQLINEKKLMIDEVIYQSFHAKRSGDVLIELEPGWVEELDDGELRSRPSLNRDLPVIFFGGQIPAGTIQKPYQMIDIAPTICTLLKISYPNGCVGKPIESLVK